MNNVYSNPIIYNYFDFKVWYQTDIECDIRQILSVISDIKCDIRYWVWYQTDRDLSNVVLPMKVPEQRNDITAVFEPTSTCTSIDLIQQYDIVLFCVVSASVHSIHLYYTQFLSWSGNFFEDFFTDFFFYFALCHFLCLLDVTCCIYSVYIYCINSL